MICWFCYWGWPKAIRDIYEEALRKLDGNESPLNYGPAHIVWEDENFNNAQWCLDNFDKYDDGLSKYEQEVVRWSLEQLLQVPEEIKNVNEAYVEAREANKDVLPEDYPPPKHIPMEK